MEDLVVKFLINDLTLEEQHELSKWIQSDDRNAKTFKKIEAYWKFHKDNLEQEELEVRLRLLNMMKGESIQTVDHSNKPSRIFLKIAASVLIFFTLILGAYQFNSTNSKNQSAEITFVEKVSLPGQKITTILPDGTKVKLNADSKIIVPSRFEGKTREVFLEGEAFFEVKRDEKHPFIIKTSEVNVQVLGTSFNVQSYGSGLAPYVAVKTGKVAVRSIETNEEVNLDPSEIVYLRQGKLVKSNVNPNSDPFAWRDLKLVFDNESASNVFDKISRWYGVEIKTSGNVTLDKMYTATYSNPTLDEIMDVLAFVYGFKYEYDEEKQLVRIH